MNLYPERLRVAELDVHTYVPDPSMGDNELELKSLGIGCPRREAFVH